ncbi:MAG: hypothetical protein SOY56_05105 [Anaerovoracaceae bacterium]|nr:hypothetical protein [Anaerovoracaceae bacterium]
MKKKKRRKRQKKKSTIDWKTITISAIVDLIVSIILEITKKLF